jgi:glycosyltransferase involved in cell wall biosynthesis
MQLSVVIISYNEELNIGRCLRSVASIADEILIVDSGSTDTTCAIAQQFGARIVQKNFEGYSNQKNFANECATFNWVLSLDADEVLSNELVQAIKIVKSKPFHDAYFIKRCTNFCGSFIKHGSWYPDKQCRLWDKTKGEWKGKIHETWRLKDTNKSYGILNGDLLHYSFNSISDYIKMTDNYTTQSAEEAFENGKNCSIFKLIFGPFVKFLIDYVIRLGFLDGYPGFVAYRLAAYSSSIKYSKIRARFKSNAKSVKYPSPLIQATRQ